MPTTMITMIKAASHPFLHSSQPRSKGSPPPLDDMSLLSTGTPPLVMAVTWSTVFPSSRQPQAEVGLAPLRRMSMHSRWPCATARARAEIPSSSTQDRTSWVRFV